MDGWKRYLKDDPIDWLLEENNPSIRYFTLRDILYLPTGHIEVKQAREKIMTQGLAPTILNKQNEGGYWGQPQDFYIRSKYRGTIWSFIILAEVGADGQDNRIQRTAEFILENSQDRQSGGFAYRGSPQGGGEHAAVIPCLTGNMLWSLIRFGYLEDPRVRQGIDWMLTYQRCDDVIRTAPSGWPFDKFPNCWGKHTCHMGVVKILRALAEIPPEKRSPAMIAAIEKAAEYFLQHHIYKRSHNLAEVSILDWQKFGFPLMPYSDALEVLWILVKMGYRDIRMKEAFDLVVAKQNEEGKWLLERTFNGRVQSNIEQKGEPSKWITLRALSAIKGFHHNHYGPC